MVSLLVDHVVLRGVARATLLRAGGLLSGSLADPDARVPLAAFHDVIDAAVQASNDPCLGLHFATRLELRDLDALGFLVMTSSTFGHALERILRYQRIWSEGQQMVLTVSGPRARLTYEQFGPVCDAHVQMAQIALGDFVVNGSRFVPGLCFDRVRFQDRASTRLEEYARVFPAPVELGAPLDEVWFPSRLLDMPMPDANSALFAFFDRYTDEKLRGIPPAGSIAPRVRALLRDDLAEGRFKLGDIAARLRMSPRTLQRRLSAESTSLHDELDAVRRQQALCFLESGMPIAELAWLLGYSAPAAFHHAFRRWTGVTPQAWRATREPA
jgi:AraC-like DNA-binding protein